MDEATKSPTDISAPAEDPSDEISPEMAGKVLISHFGEVHVARTRLNDAICQNRVASFADGVRVRADYFASCMMVSIAHGTTDQFEIRPFAGLHGNNPETGRPYVWTVSHKDVLNLIEDNTPSNKTGVKRGPKIKFNWNQLVAEVIRIEHVEGLPAGDSELAGALLTWCGEQELEDIPEYETIRKKVGIWLSRYRRA
jgi:hypothetical protein